MLDPDVAYAARDELSRERATWRGRERERTEDGRAERSRAEVEGR